MHGLAHYLQIIFNTHVPEIFKMRQMFQHDRKINSETCETGKQSQLISNVLYFERSYYEWLKTKKQLPFWCFQEFSNS